MKHHLSPRSIFVFSSRTLFTNSDIPPISLIRFSQLSTSSNQFFPSSQSSSSYHSRRQEEESRLVKVSVWWDFENCAVPPGANVFKVTQSITAAIRGKGIKGPVQITAFGDVLQLSRSNQEALSATGINLTHVPRGGKNSADRSLLVDLMSWVSQNPPPAHLFLISSDRDFANILHRLRLNNYNILLSSLDHAPKVLCSAASIMWQWNALVRGEDLCGKHFNQPPDGPHGSWYGQYRFPLEDPFAVEQPPLSQADDSSQSGSQPNLRPVPMTVVRQIRHLLNSYPEGISIKDLQSELGKTNLSLDKDLYGYKKFSCFILSNSNILKIQSWGEDQLSIRSIAPKGNKSNMGTPDATPGSLSNTGNQHEVVSETRNGKNSSCLGLAEKAVSLKHGEEVPQGKLKKSSNQVEEPLKTVPNTSSFTRKAHNIEVAVEPSRQLKESPKKVEEPLHKVPDTPLLVEDTNIEVRRNHLQSLEGHDPGLFKRIWRKRFGAKEDSGFQENTERPVKAATYSSSTEKREDTKENCVDPVSQCADPIGFASKSSSEDEPFVDENSAERCKSDEKSTSGTGLFNHIVIRWCRFWYGLKLKNSIELSSENSDVAECDKEERGIFSTESFWNEVVAFIYTTRGSDIVMWSKSREEMAQYLQMEGPSVIRCLKERDLLHLVDLLISDKELVVEYPSRKFPFKLNRPVENSDVSCSSGPRSVCLKTQSLPEAKKLPEHEERSSRNLSHTGVSPQVTQKDSSISRDQILQDCQMLVDDIVKEYPNGFNMGGFRKLFLDRYGYSLDLRMLGYQKLVSLLQIMSGAKVECNFIMPEHSSGSIVSNTTAISDSHSLPESLKKYELEAQWEELGPISHTSRKRNEMESSSRIVNEETTGQENHSYESLPDDYSSGSDVENSLLASEMQEKPRVKGEDSALLQILDSWHRSKEDNTRRFSSENVDGGDDCSRKGTETTSCKVGISNVAPVESSGRKEKPSKSYSFVVEHVADDKDKLVDGILGSLKKSGERSERLGKSRIEA